MMSRGGRPESNGFTLIELMIVVAIVALLSAIALPSYQEHVIKSRRAEGKAVIMQAAQGLERCYTQFGRYNADQCATAVLLSGGGIIPSEGDWYHVSGSFGVDGQSFALAAAPQNAQTKDSKCGILSLDNLGIKGFSGSGTVHSCWG